MYHERRPDEETPAVRWRPFQLNPDVPTEGMPRQAYLERKFGPGHAHSYARVAGVGREVGIDFAFDRITVQPNTLNAHRLMLYGATQGPSQVPAPFFLSKRSAVCAFHLRRRHWRGGYCFAWCNLQ